MNQTKIKLFNLIFASVILLMNLFVYFPLLIFIIAEDGGPMGFGYVVVPFILLINMFVFTALYSFKKLNQNHIGYFIVNLIGFLICISFTMFVTINH